MKIIEKKVNRIEIILSFAFANPKANIPKKSTNQQNHKTMQEYIGKKVLIRANGAGVYFGTLERMEGDQVKVTNVRNIWHWTGASCLSQIANEGVIGDKIGPTVSSMVINNVLQVIPLTDRAITNLESHKEWKA